MFERAGEMADVATNIKLSLILDPATCSDLETVEGMIQVFPAGARPHLNVWAHVLESAGGGQPYLALSIVASIAWVARKVPAPSLDEIGNRLRDAVKVYFDRRKTVPSGVQLWLSLSEIEFRVSVNTEKLMCWTDDQHQFRTLGELIDEEFPQLKSLNAATVFLLWDTKLNCWRFTTIWPSDLNFPD